MSMLESARPLFEQVDGAQQHERKHQQHHGQRDRAGIIDIPPAASTMRYGAISVLNGRLPEMKTIEPYSPMARANASAKPVMTGGNNDGAMTLTNVRNRPAPSVAAASSTSSSRFSKTGCSVRTTNGMPTNVSAMTTPSGVNAPLIPSGTRNCPSQPLAANKIGQRQAGDRRRQRERKIHHGVNEAAARKFVAHEHPREQRAEDGVGAAPQ